MRHACCSLFASVMLALPSAATPTSMAPGSAVVSKPEIETPPAAKPLSGPRRCVNARGETIFTDADCGDIEAVEKPLVRPMVGNTLGFSKPVITHACARSAEDLQWSMQSAIEKKDVNQLAGLYDWTGFGHDTANQVLDRLKLVADGALMSVELLYPQRHQRTEIPPSLSALPDAASPTPSTTAEAKSSNLPRAHSSASVPSRGAQASGGSEDPDMPLASVDYQAPPWGVVVYQSGKGDAPARSTRFQITRNHGCLWLRF